MAETEITALAERAAELMRQRLGASAGDLPGALRQRGRRLPRPVRRAAQELAEAAALAGHPRLRQRLDRKRAEQAGARVLSYLEPLGRAERRRRLALSMLGSVAFGLLGTLALLLGLLFWRGFI